MSNCLPSPFITLAGIHNLRPLPTLELPHHPASSRSNPITLKPSTIWRSAEPYKADPEELKKLGIKYVFDLRSKPEFDMAEHGLGWAAHPAEGIERIWVPIFEDEGYNPERLAERFMKYMSEGKKGFPQAYLEFLLAAGPAYARIFSQLASDSSTGILVHCTAGKDRTGVFVALLLSLLGATDDAIADEYALTDIGLAELRPGYEATIWKNLQARNPELVKEKGPEKALEGVRRSTGSQRENMLWTLELLKERWESAEGWLRKECGFSGEQIMALREGLTMDGDAKASLL
ncbi:tyrosine protein phosphatase 5 [Pseudovirgaria hyperparasitica]|uniref:Tyrosine protein phosphatase 5 n=1 Tax=Pseudovirgaria hyperparasitica TaxID=470096 RepID=A0A6A6W909_9PEZI|nr:tyrosine protein phosphatase 5 [Pseudovirgaria hyperparasitica]KAF2758376.1 tyrosine protein phosphatase 5 [Pseudovirgaria hyperparasitica]